MNTQHNIAENQEKFFIQVDPQIAKIVSPFDRKELAGTYLMMFTGFTWRNWTNKYSLGRAWQTALAQCGAFADTKNDKNPAAKYLKNVYGAHKKYWSRVIMTHGGRDNVINPDDNKIKELRAHGERMIREAMDKINLILARYNERTEEMVAGQTKEKTQMHATAQAQAQPQPQPQPQPQQASAQTPAVAQATERPMAQPMAQAVKSVAQPAQQSGAFAMVRDNVKRANTAIVDKPADMPARVAKPAQTVKPVEKKPAQPAIKMSKPQERPQPIVYHAQKSVAQPAKQSGALPAVQDKTKQAKVVKAESKVNEFASAQRRIEISAEQRTQMQIEFQRRIQMWQINQFKQNAA